MIKWFKSKDKLKISIPDFLAETYEIDNSPITVPDEILNNYENWKRFEYLSEQESKQVLNKSLDHYIDSFEKLIVNIECYFFYEQVLALYEYLSEQRENSRKSGNVEVEFFSLRIRFCRIILEEASKIPLNTSKVSFLKESPHSIICDFYRIFRNISSISSFIPLKDILNINYVSIEKKSNFTQILETNFDSQNIRISFDFIRKYSTSRYLNKDYQRVFFDELERVGLSEQHFYKKLVKLFKSSKKLISSKKFRKVTNSEGTPFEKVILGLVLCPNTIESVKKRIQKPLESPRHLFYPILQWRINEEDFMIVRNRAFIDGFQYLIGDMLTNEKLPQYWKDLFGKEGVKVLKQGKDFEEFIERLVGESNFPLITQYKCKISANEHVVPDIIFYDKSTNTFRIVECKNLIKRSDPSGWMNDYKAFHYPGRKKAFNNKMDKLISYLNQNLTELSKRFEKDHDIKINDRPSLECLFVVNTPTLYMFNSKYRILPWELFNEMLVSKNFNEEIYYENEHFCISQNLRFFLPGNNPTFVSSKKGGLS